MSSKILVYIDQFKGQPLPTSWELITAGKSLGGEVTALVIGSGVEAIAQTAFQFGADHVVAADDPALTDYIAEPYTSIIAAQAADAAVVLFPTTTRGRELAGMTAIDLNTGVLTDVTALELDGDRVLATKPIYAGKLLSKVVCKTDPQIITVRTRAFTKPAQEASLSGTVQAAAPSGDAVKTTVTGYAETEGGVSLTDAGVIVSGGRGVSNNPKLETPAGLDDKAAEVWRAQQGFTLVGDLAAALNGAVGASRAAVDAGYIPYLHQVGQTGKLVSPDLYIAAGISGAIQHLAGMRTSKVIVAINKDPDAPIFKLARYGVVGDLFDILPHLTEAFKAQLG